MLTYRMPNAVIISNVGGKKRTIANASSKHEVKKDIELLGIGRLNEKAAKKFTKP